MNDANIISFDTDRHITFTYLLSIFVSGVDDTMDTTVSAAWPFWLLVGVVFREVELGATSASPLLRPFLFISCNGIASSPTSPSPINGKEFQFVFLFYKDVLTGLE